jgi:hypothetical protein
MPCKQPEQADLDTLARELSAAGFQPPFEGFDDVAWSEDFISRRRFDQPR